MNTDFHLHSTASDGTLDPAALVRELAARDIGWAALTDHDTVAGWSSASREAHGLGIEITPGTELSVVCQGDPVHLLALGFDPSHPPLAAWLDQFRSDRRERAEAMLKKLRGAGVPVDASVLPSEAGDGVVTRPHIADAVVAAGGAATNGEVFERYIGDGAPCFVPMPPRASAEAIRIIHGAGGIAVLAHPGDWTAHRTVVELVREGLDGIEAGHPMHDDTLRSYYEAMAIGHGLVVTAGSDFHGRSAAEFDRLGGFHLAEPLRDLLRERLRKARTRA
jgi:hypothetical protein